MAKLAFFVTVRRSGSEVMIFWTRATVEGVLAWVGWVGFGGRGEVWMGGHTWERDVAGYFLGGGDGGVVVGHGGEVPVKGWWGRAWGGMCGWVYLVGWMFG